MRELLWGRFLEQIRFEIVPISKLTLPSAYPLLSSSISRPAALFIRTAHKFAYG